MKADKILVNGKIFSGLSEAIHDFLAISGNRILAIGSGSGKSYLGRSTEVIDLKGCFVVPGLVDSHLHFLDYALSLDRVSLDHCQSVSEVMTLLRKRALQTKHGEWILGRGWSKKLFDGFPNKKLLDEIFPENPVVLNSHDEHFLWVNSQTLKAAGQTTPSSVPGGYTGTEVDGTSNGIFGENAIPLIRNSIPKPDAATRRNSILRAQEALHRLGITGFHSMDANQAFGDLQDLRAEDKLKLRVFHSIPLRQLEDAVRISLKSGFGDAWFQFGFVKIFSDGTLGSQTAWMLEPFGRTDQYGMESISEQNLSEKIELALRHGIAVAVHAIGDRANRQVLNAFEQNRHLLKIPRASSRIEHAQLLHPLDIDRFAMLGIVASMQPYHAISDRELAEQHWGTRSKYAYAWRSLLEAGAVLAFGSDAPVENPDPLQGLAAAVDRSGWTDDSQTISPFHALLAYTYNPAHISGNEKNSGSLQPKKLADFVVLS
ncbi:MAG TPA: amidohydrolase, partial [Acidobacteriota bacterium]